MCLHVLMLHSIWCFVQFPVFLSWIVAAKFFYHELQLLNLPRPSTFLFDFSELENAIWLLLLFSLFWSFCNAWICFRYCWIRHGNTWSSNPSKLVNQFVFHDDNFISWCWSLISESSIDSDHRLEQIIDLSWVDLSFLSFVECCVPRLEVVVKTCWSPFSITQWCGLARARDSVWLACVTLWGALDALSLLRFRLWCIVRSQMPYRFCCLC